MSADMVIVLLTVLGGGVLIGVSFTLHHLRLNEDKKNNHNFLKALPVKEGDNILILGKNISFNNGIEGFHISTPDEHVTRRFYTEFLESIEKVLEKHSIVCRKLYKHRLFLIYKYTFHKNYDVHAEVKSVGCFHSNRSGTDIRDVAWSESLLMFLTKMNLCFIISGLYADRKGLMFEFPGEVTTNEEILNKIGSARKKGLSLFEENINISVTKTGFRNKSDTWRKLLKKKQGIDSWFKKHHEADIVAGLVFEDIVLDKHLFSEDNGKNLEKDTITYFMKYKDKLGNKISTDIYVKTSVIPIGHNSIGIETILMDNVRRSLGIGVVVPMKLTKI